LVTSGQGGVDNAQAAAGAVLADFGRNAVGAVNGRVRPLGDFVLAIDEDGAFAAESSTTKVVDDFLADVDGGPKASRAMRTTSMARTTPAQKPRGFSRSKVFPWVFGNVLSSH